MAEEPVEFVRSIICHSADVDDADALTALCMRSKAHWGYDDQFMLTAREALTIRKKDIACGWVMKAFLNGELAGVVQLVPLADHDRIELDKLFVDPPAMGEGVGRHLMRTATMIAKERGFEVMEILADPNAVAFYERIGARYIRDEPSDAIPGRTLPLYELKL